MNCHGRNTLSRCLIVLALLTAATGCHSMQPGAPHPFTTIVQPENYAYHVESPLDAQPNSVDGECRLAACDTLKSRGIRQ